MDEVVLDVVVVTEDAAFRRRLWAAFAADPDATCDLLANSAVDGVVVRRIWLRDGSGRHVERRRIPVAGAVWATAEGDPAISFVRRDASVLDLTANLTASGGGYALDLVVATDRVFGEPMRITPEIRVEETLALTPDRWTQLDRGTGNSWVALRVRPADQGEALAAAVAGLASPWPAAPHTEREVRRGLSALSR